MSAKKMIKPSKKDFSKEAMYRKIMPSMQSATDNDSDESVAADEHDMLPASGPRNVMEYIVRAKVGSAVDRLGACACGQCRDDCVALALNSLPSMYAVADYEHVKEKARDIRSKYEIKITAAVIRAVQIVMSSPRH